MRRLPSLIMLVLLVWGIAPTSGATADEPDDPDPDCCGPLHGFPPEQSEWWDDVWSEVPPQGNDVEVTALSLVAGAQGVATGGFGCAARAAADAESVRIVSCTSGPDFANTVVAPGSFAVTAGIHTETSSTTMMREVCYEVEVRYLDGRTPQRIHGCSQAVVFLE